MLISSFREEFGSLDFPGRLEAPTLRWVKLRPGGATYDPKNYFVRPTEPLQSFLQKPKPERCRTGWFERASDEGVRMQPQTRPPVPIFVRLKLVSLLHLFRPR